MKRDLNTWFILVVSFLVVFWVFTFSAYYLGKYHGKQEITKTSCYKYIVEHEEKLMEKYKFVRK